MKWNVSTYVVIAFGAFMVFILTLVVKTYQFKVDLVSEDYYGQELKYQEKINRMNRLSDSSSRIFWKQDTTSIILTFPKVEDGRKVNGKVEFYRPSDSSKDIIIELNPGDQQQQFIEKSLLLTGLYKMKIDWEVNGVGYYTEEDIYIQ